MFPGLELGKRKVEGEGLYICWGWGQIRKKKTKQQVSCYSSGDETAGLALRSSKSDLCFLFVREIFNSLQNSIFVILFRIKFGLCCQIPGSGTCPSYYLFIILIIKLTMALSPVYHQ